MSWQATRATARARLPLFLIGAAMIIAERVQHPSNQIEMLEKDLADWMRCSLASAHRYISALREVGYLVDVFVAKGRGISVFQIAPLLDPMWTPKSRKPRDVDPIEIKRKAAIRSKPEADNDSKAGADEPAEPLPVCAEPLPGCAEPLPVCNGTASGLPSLLRSIPSFPKEEARNSSVSDAHARAGAREGGQFIPGQDGPGRQAARAYIRGLVANPDLPRNPQGADQDDDPAQAEQRRKALEELAKRPKPEG